MSEMLCSSCKIPVLPERYELTRCPKCGHILKTAFPPITGERMLKAYYDREHDTITLMGNRAGLEYLAQWCLKIIRPDNEKEHAHLEWQTRDLLKGSDLVIVQFTTDSADYK